MWNSKGPILKTFLKKNNLGKRALPDLEPYVRPSKVKCKPTIRVSESPISLLQIFFPTLWSSPRPHEALVQSVRSPPRLLSLSHRLPSLGLCSFPFPCLQFSNPFVPATLGLAPLKHYLQNLIQLYIFLPSSCNYVPSNSQVSPWFPPSILVFLS